jgi:23S rRNA pseudouridine955/2504/2580 synthase
LQVKVNQSFNRLDKFLFQYFESIPLSLIQRLIRQYKIKINNKKSKANSDLKKGDIIFIYYNFEIKNQKNFTIKISEDFRKTLRKKIIFENNDFIIINKHRGYSVQRGSKVRTSLKDYYESLLGYPLYIVHRLDKDTSGLMIFTKNRLVASGISKLFLSNNIHKYYLAKTHKSFNKQSGMLENVNNENKLLKLFYRKINSTKDEHLYLIKLLTGRKHQIRLQFFLNDNPIIGDKKFSQNKNENLSLCSISVRFYYLNKFYKFNLNLNEID